jgi:chromate transporter
VSLSGLFWVFLKVGATLFGSGHVIVAYLRSDLVERLGWLTGAQLLDAVAVGQLTPGPVLTSATFVGCLLAGPNGAVVATVAIFLSAFVLVALSAPLVPRLRESATLGTILDGVIAASLALLAVVTLQVARAAAVDAVTIGLALAAAALLFFTRVHPTWIVLGGATAGLLAHALGSTG